MAPSYIDTHRLFFQHVILEKKYDKNEVAYLALYIEGETNGRYLSDDISKRISWMKMYDFRLWFHGWSFPKCQINNIPPLVHVRHGVGQATSHYQKQWWLVYWGIYTSFGLDEITECIYMATAIDNRHPEVSTSGKLLFISCESLTLSGRGYIFLAKLLSDCDSVTCLSEYKSNYLQVCISLKITVVSNNLLLFYWSDSWYFLVKSTASHTHTHPHINASPES